MAKKEVIICDNCSSKVKDITSCEMGEYKCILCNHDICEDCIYNNSNGYCANGDGAEMMEGKFTQDDIEWMLEALAKGGLEFRKNCAVCEVCIYKLMKNAELMCEAIDPTLPQKIQEIFNAKAQKGLKTSKSSKKNGRKNKGLGKKPSH